MKKPSNLDYGQGRKNRDYWSMRDLDDKELGQNSDFSLSPLPSRLFLIASSLSPHLARFLARHVGRPRSHLRCSVGLTIGLAIGGAMLIVGDVAIGLSGWSLRNELICFLICWTAEADSQVFFSSEYSFHETR